MKTIVQFLENEHTRSLSLCSHILKKYLGDWKMEWNAIFPTPRTLNYLPWTNFWMVFLPQPHLLPVPPTFWVAGTTMNVVGGSLTGKLLSKDSLREWCQGKLAREWGEQERAGRSSAAAVCSQLESGFLMIAAIKWVSPQCGSSWSPMWRLYNFNIVSCPDCLRGVRRQRGSLLRSLEKTSLLGKDVEDRCPSWEKKL